ncbi:MAG: tyrosine-type recombinase/integrase [Acidimicrobiales bacterium]
MAQGRSGTTSKRRGAGEGGIRFEDGYWVATIEAGRHAVTGKRLRIKRKARTKKEALAKAREARKALDNGLPFAAASTLLGDFLDQWITTVVPARVGSDNTVANYRAVIDGHIKPALGKVPVAKLTPEQVDRFLAAKAAAGLSRSYVGRMRSILADALSHAESRGTVARNVARLAVMPKCQPTKGRRSMTPVEARAMLEATSGERLGALIVCGLTLGLRPGELTGLLWADLDLDATPPTLAITGSIKRRIDDSTLYRGAVKRSTAGERTLAIPSVLVAALVDHRKRQAAERLTLGDIWQDHGLIFPSETGSPLDPSNVRRTFTRIARRAGIEGAAMPYLMRHSVASLLLDSGASIEDVADLLGDDPQTLYRHYRHRVRPVADAAAERMQRLLG